MSFLTLDQFLQSALERWNTHRISSRHHVVEPGFSTLYVRLTRRFFNGVSHEPVLDIATVEVDEELRAQGRFTQLVRDVRLNYPNLHIYVESVGTDRFCQGLVRRGFSLIADGPSFALCAGETMQSTS